MAKRKPRKPRNLVVMQMILHTKGHQFEEKKDLSDEKLIEEELEFYKENDLDE